ncbi:acetyl-coenzyme A transporter 1-domain-containing protein [Xylariomycetidae sp. FL2044]|nr:acetyl-coenzyme A transporter 1-domain-containing protein [Xylariomycetidae sp. FL2044]
MNGLTESKRSIELRRRSSEAPLHDDLANLSDSLEEQVPPKPALSYVEIKNLTMLFGLYFVHYLPLLFSWATMPIILRQQLSYSDVGTFLLSQYPYSWKVAWSPIVDAVFVPRIGRRKTWIIPSFLGAAAVLVWLAGSQDGLVSGVARGESFGMVWLVLAGLLVMVLCANIRIALDSWSLDLVSQANVHWTSPMASVAEMSAGFVALNVYLGLTALNGAKDESGKDEPASTRLFYGITAIVFVAVAMLLGLGKRETEEGSQKMTIRKAYAVIWKVITVRQVWILMLVHMISMIGFMTNDTITVLQLVKNNFDDFDLAALATAVLPVTLIGSYFVARTFETRHPLHVWRSMFPWRLLVAFLSQLSILFVSVYPSSPFRWVIVFVPGCLAKFFENGMWICFLAFHAQISDPHYGGIYMSLLATTLNIRYDALQFIFTEMVGAIDGSDDLTKPSPLIDGYQIVNAVAVLLAIPIYWFFLIPATKYLQTVELSVWRVNDGGATHNGQAYEMIRIEEDDDHEA